MDRPETTQTEPSNHTQCRLCEGSGIVHDRPCGACNGNGWIVCRPPEGEHSDGSKSGVLDVQPNQTDQNGKASNPAAGDTYTFKKTTADSPVPTANANSEASPARDGTEQRDADGGTFDSMIESMFESARESEAGGAITPRPEPSLDDTGIYRGPTAPTAETPPAPDDETANAERVAATEIFRESPLPSETASDPDPGESSPPERAATEIFRASPLPAETDLESDPGESIAPKCAATEIYRESPLPSESKPSDTDSNSAENAAPERPCDPRLDVTQIYRGSESNAPDSATPTAASSGDAGTLRDSQLPPDAGQAQPSPDPEVELEQLHAELGRIKTRIATLEIEMGKGEPKAGKSGEGSREGKAGREDRSDQSKREGKGPKTTKEFFDLLEQSELLAPRTLEKARSAGDDVRVAARRLIKTGFLTDWQAAQLVAGRSSFFLDKYKLIRLINHGEMGNVFLAEHVTMNRQVAIKTIPKELTQDPAARERLLAEARTLAELDHPNIVQAYCVDQIGDRFYLVLEHVDGKSLKEIVNEKGTLDYGTAADYIGQAARGLQHGHKNHIVHGAVKPGNLLVDVAGNVKIVDMGLSCFVETDDIGVRKMDDRQMLGSIDYLAPEQVLGNASFDHRADIYSLGCTLYFLLTGKPPFGEGTLAERLLQHRSGEPESIKQLRHDVPAEMISICERMLSKNPDDRFQSTKEVGKALAPFRQDAANAATCASNLCEIAGMLLGYRVRHNCLPPSQILDMEGNPIHSWRAMVLEDAAGVGNPDARYNLAYPWDHPENEELVTDPAYASLFACPSDPKALATGNTNYVAVVGEDTLWKKGEQRSFDEIDGRVADKILLIEVPVSGIPWTEPRDISLKQALELYGRKNGLCDSRHLNGLHYVTVGMQYGTIASIESIEKFQEMLHVKTVESPKEPKQPRRPRSNGSKSAVAKSTSSNAAGKPANGSSQSTSKTAGSSGGKGKSLRAKRPKSKKR